MARTLTAIQREVLAMIKASLDVLGRPPSFRELADWRGGQSTNAVQCVVRALDREGMLVTQVKKQARALLVSPKGLRTLHDKPLAMSAEDKEATIAKLSQLQALLSAAESSAPFVLVEDFVDRMLGRETNADLRYWREKLRGERT